VSLCPCSNGICPAANCGAKFIEGIATDGAGRGDESQFPVGFPSQKRDGWHDPDATTPTKYSYSTGETVQRLWDVLPKI
jgi:hypothetical protein